MSPWTFHVGLNVTVDETWVDVTSRHWEENGSAIRVNSIATLSGNFAGCNSDVYKSTTLLLATFKSCLLSAHLSVSTASVRSQTSLSAPVTSELANQHLFKDVLKWHLGHLALTSYLMILDWKVSGTLTSSESTFGPNRDITKLSPYNCGLCWAKLLLLSCITSYFL